MSEKWEVWVRGGLGGAVVVVGAWCRVQHCGFAEAGDLANLVGGSAGEKVMAHPTRHTYSSRIELQRVVCRFGRDVGNTATQGKYVSVLSRNSNTLSNLRC